MPHNLSCSTPMVSLYDASFIFLCCFQAGIPSECVPVHPLYIVFYSDAGWRTYAEIKCLLFLYVKRFRPEVRAMHEEAPPPFCRICRSA